MSTGLKKVDIFLKKFLPQQQITENFFDYLESKIHESLYWVYRKQGVFSPNPSVQPLLSSGAPNTITFFTPLVGTDGPGGHILSLDPADASNVPFENANGITYHTGLRWNRLPKETEINVRTGKVKYSFLEESIGELAEPNSVVDNGDGTMTLVIDNVCETNVSHAGRKCLVWLKDAVSLAGAFEEVTVSFSGGQNKITTTTLLGQILGNVIVDATKYQVFLKGPTIRRNTDLSLDPSIIYTGTVVGAGTGNTPSSFSTGGVSNLSGLGEIASLIHTTKAFLTRGGTITWDMTTSTLSWSSDLKVRMPTKPYDFTILAGSQAAIADQDFLYIQLDEVGGNKAMIKVANGAVPTDPLAFPIAMRDGNDIYFANGALELKGDSTPTSGTIQDITQDLLTYIGALNESDSDPNYPSANIVTQGASLTQAIGELDAALILALSDSALEDEVIAIAGQTVVNFPLIFFDPSNGSWDTQWFRGPSRVFQDPAGGLNEDLRKIGVNAIEFAYPLRAGDRIKARREKTAVAALAPQPFFLNYVTGITGPTVPVGDSYNVGTDKLSVYRNGIYLVKSPSLGMPVDRYVEGSLNSIAVGLAAAPSDIFTFENLASLPTARQFATGLTGTVLSVPTYVMGSKRLRIFRNGVLMNSSGLGSAVEQYTETSTTSITLATASLASDLWTYYVASSAPTFREDLDGFSGTVLNISGTYVIGDERLLVFKNGVLLFNSLSLGVAGDRYQETGTSQVTLGAAAVVSDWFSFIYM